MHCRNYLLASHNLNMKMIRGIVTTQLFMLKQLDTSHGLRQGTRVLCVRRNVSTSTWSQTSIKFRRLSFEYHEMRI